jgi:hypothetical protein
METKEIDSIPETLRASDNAIGVALRERAGDAGMKTFEELDNDDTDNGQVS